MRTRRYHRQNIILIVLFVLAGASSSLAQATQDVDPEIDSVVANSIEALYTTKCAQCHGADGRGTADSGVDPLNLDQTVEELTQVITDTMPEGDPESCVGEEAARLAKYVREKFGNHVFREVPQLSRLTVQQYRNAIADVIGRFPNREVSNSRFNDRSRYLSSLRQTPGLRGDYYQSLGNSKANRLAYYRTDTRLDFDFGGDSPAPTISSDQFAIVWNGSLVAPRTGYYQFRLQTFNGARLYVNADPSPKGSGLREESTTAAQQPLIDAWVGSGSQQEKTARIYLLGGRQYPLRLEFFKFFEDQASVSLRWKPPNETWKVLDYNDTFSAPVPRVFVTTAGFPADDQSLGYARGNVVSPQWQEATTDAAIEAAAEVVDRLDHLAGLSALDFEDSSNSSAKAKNEAQQIQAQRVSQTREFLLEFVRTAYRRPLTESEQAIVQDIFDASQKNIEQGVRRVVVMALLSPHFLYPDLTPAGESPSPYTVAARLSFGLWDSIPDAQLIQAAADKKLASAEQISAQARRMLRDARAKAKLNRFFSEWLELEYRDLSKDKALFPEFDEATIADLRRSLHLFIERVVWSGPSDYRQLLQANYLMLNQPLRKLYADGAVLSDKVNKTKKVLNRIASRRQFASEFQPVDFPKDQRSGILTHPYLLSAFAYHNNTSPIHRGVFLTRNVVGRTLRPPPNAVAFKEDEFDPHLTMREKITQLTSDSACMSCHSVINPLGFTLEHFDAVGRWRETDNQHPVDSRSQYTTHDGEQLTLTSAQDVAKVAIESDFAQQAFVGAVFEYVLRRSARDVDDQLIDRLHAKFKDDQFHLRKLWALTATVAACQNVADPADILKVKK